MRDEAGDRSAEGGRDQRRHQQADPQVRDEVRLRQAHCVGADAEEGTVPERRETGIAKQHVEAERVDAEHEHLDPQIGIETDLTYPERHAAEDREDDQHRLGRPAAQPGDDRGRRFHRSRMLFLPSSPRARRVPTANRGKHIEISDQSLEWARVSPTATPISRRASTAPKKLPPPPRTMTMKAGTTASMPTWGRTPQIGAMITPATAARPLPNANTSRRSRGRLTPSARTISLWCAPALISAPYGVRSRNSHTRAMTPTAKADA